MPRIETFEKDNTITGNDKLLGTDVSEIGRAHV